jgi:hypothetical protein
MAPRVDQRTDEDLRKGAVEADLSADPHSDEGEWHTGAVALTENVMSADSTEVKHAEEELGADEDGTPG